MNSETLQYIQDNYAHIFKKAAGLGSREELEDALSELVITLLTKPYDIQTPQSFVYTSMLNFLVAERKKGVVKNSVSISNTEDNKEFTNFAAPCLFTLMEEQGDHNMKMQNMMEAINVLPEHQKSAILNYFKYEKTSLVPGNPNTNKANFRLATLKLKEILT